MSKRLKTGDQVVVIAGNEKGKSGKVLRVHKGRVAIEGINKRKKHVRPTQDNPKSGGILELEAPMHISNVMPCDGEGKRVRLRIRSTEEGSKELVYGAANKETVYRKLKG